MVTIAVSGGKAKILDAAAQTLRNALCGVLRHTHEDEGEFVAADTRDEVILLDCLAK